MERGKDREEKIGENRDGKGKRKGERRRKSRKGKGGTKGRAEEQRVIEGVVWTKEQ